MSNERSWRPSCSTTIGINGIRASWERATCRLRQRIPNLTVADWRRHASEPRDRLPRPAERGVGGPDGSRAAPRGARETATATELAAELPVTRQAVAKHLAALNDAGLVESRREGRETRYELTPGPLAAAMDWMASVGAEWDSRLAALRKHLASRR